MIQVNIHEAKTHLSRLLNRALEGEEVVIAKDNKPIARLCRIEKTKPRRRLGSLKKGISVSPDFDASLDDFKEYTA